MTIELKTRAWNAKENLDTEEDMAAYLEAALEDGDLALIRAALSYIARAKGVTHLAHDTGLSRESLHEALSPEGDPEFATILKAINALGLKLHASTTNVRM